MKFIVFIVGVFLIGSTYSQNSESREYAGKKRYVNKYKNKVDGAYFFENYPKFDTEFKRKLVEAGDLGYIGDRTYEPQKGVLVSQAIYNRLEKELSGKFWGWGPNDLIVSRVIDNRNNRQRGVIYTVRPLLRFFSTKIAKIGTGEVENKKLTKARNGKFDFSSESWGLFFWYSAESSYRNGIELMKEYEEDLLSTQDPYSISYNFRVDDIHGLLKLIEGEELLDHLIGILVQPDEEVGFRETDDRVYFTVGAAYVIRDILVTVAHLYPEFFREETQRHLDLVFKSLNRIITFNPLVVWNQRHDGMFANHRKLLASYVERLEKNLRDIANTIKY